MTGPDAVIDPPGSNEELPEDDHPSDDDINDEATHIYDQIADPLGGQTDAVRAATESAQRAALADASAMDRVATAQRRMAQFDVANGYQRLHLSPASQEICRKTALAVTVGAVVGGILAGGAVLAMYLSTAQQVANTAPPTDGDPEEDAFEKQVRELVNTWQQLPEDKYWLAMADWVRKNNPSWFRQRYVATYASSIAKDEASGVDLDAAAQKIVERWGIVQPDASRLYNGLATATINDVALTRKDKLVALVRAIDIISPPTPS